MSNRRTGYIILTALGVQLLLISYAAMLFKNTPDVSTRTNPYMVSEYRNSNVVFDQMVDDRIIRDCLTGEVVKDLRSRWAPETEHFMSEHDRTKTTGNNDLNRVNAFVGIFDKNMWGGDQDETGAGPVASGLGSTLNYAQDIICILHTLVTVLKLTLKKQKVRLLDVPCGDMQWMSRFLQTRNDVIYTGMDIVPSLIIRHRQTFTNQNWRFIQHDMVKSPLNESFDLILSRHVLQHLSYNDVLKFLHHVSESGSSYFLTSTFPNFTTQIDIKAGDFRYTNLQAPPLSLRPPLCLHKDGPRIDGGFQGLWPLPLKRIPKCTFQNIIPNKEAFSDFVAC